MRIFTEIQRFNQWWIQLLNLGMVLFLLCALYQWFVAKEPTGNVAPDDIIGQLVLIFATIPVLLLLYYMKLESSIDEIGIHYQFLPFHFSKKTVRWSDMLECNVRKYNPIREFGGWGLRGSLGKNRAYSIKGNMGIQMILKDGKKILIGTQRKAEAQQVLDRYFKKK